MVRFISICIDAGSVLVVFFPVMAVLYGTLFRQQGWKKKLWVFCFVIYLSAVFSAIGIPSVKGLILEPQFHWIPLIDILGDPLAMKSAILNVLLFVPLGVLLPVIWEGYRSWKRTCAVGLGLSLGIEILQIFTYRLTDIDDLITNTLGTLTGYCIFSFLAKKIPMAPLPVSKKWEPFFLCGMVFFLMFAVSPLISHVLWELVLSGPLWDKIR